MKRYSMHHEAGSHGEMQENAIGAYVYAWEVREAVQREREEIIKELEHNLEGLWVPSYLDGIRVCIDCIKARGRPKGIEKMASDDYIDVRAKIDELIDAVNELRRKP